MKTAFICGAAELCGRPLSAVGDDIIIAADGGFEQLLAHGIKPDVLIGDFDSMPRADAESFANIIAHKPEKDDTDMALAADYAFEKGFGRMHIYGGCGGRFDHSFANISLLASLAARGAQAYMFGKDFAFAAVSDGRLDFECGYQGIISVFAFGGTAYGVNLHGLKYPLTDYTMLPDRAIGVSNEFVGTHSSVSVKNGLLVVMWQDDPKHPLPVFSKN